MLWYETDVHGSFNIFSYAKTVVWLPSLSCAMVQKLTSEGLETFSSCLLYTCETAYYNMVAAVKREHHLLGQCSLSASEQHRPRDHSFRPEAGPAANLPASESGAKQPATVWVISSQVWVCKCLTLANVVQHHRLSWRNRPAQFVFSNPADIFIQTQMCVFFIPFECRPKGNNCIKRILWSLAQLYTLTYVLPAAFSVTPVTTTTYYVPVYRRFAVFLCVPPHKT